MADIIGSGIKTPRDDHWGGFDPVDRPSHYAGNKIEAIEVIEQWGFGYHLGNSFKYMSRALTKHADPAMQVQDICKFWRYASRARNLALHWGNVNGLYVPIDSAGSGVEW